MPFDDIETADAATYARAFRALAAILRHLLPDYAVGLKGDGRGVLPRRFASVESIDTVDTPAGARSIAAINAPPTLAPTAFRDAPVDIARSA